MALGIAKGERIMQKKKLLALLLAFTCAAVTLVGCGTGKETQETVET